MVNQKSPRSDDATYMKKIRKPLVEKRRRDRMNHCLEQLKTLLTVKIKQNTSSSMARLDKADILEMTVGHLATLLDHQRSVTLATTVEGYRKGFKDCARETFNFLSSTHSLDNKSLNQLNAHLQTTYLQKTHRGAASCSTVKLAEATYAHASSIQDIQTTDGHSHARSHLPSAVTGFYNGAISGQIAYFDVHRTNYSTSNDSFDSSLNSSTNMSLDSSSSTTPEKIVPGQSTDEVWRPW